MKGLLLRIPDGASVALLVRNVPPKQSREVEVMSPGEKRQAEAFGRLIAGDCSVVASSPDVRSTRTAQAIARGLRFSSSNVSADVTNDPLLGDPGLFVLAEHSAEAREQFARLGKRGIAASLASGIRVPGWTPDPVQTARNLARHCLSQVGEGATSHGILVSYDVVLMLMVGCLTGRFVPEGQWPSFLEAVAHYIADGMRTVRLVYRSIDEEVAL